MLNSVVESAGFFASETWLEQQINAKDTFSVDRGDVSARELEGLLLVNFRNRCELCVAIQTNVLNQCRSLRWRIFMQPSWIGAVCDTPSESATKSVVRPKAGRNRTVAVPISRPALAVQAGGARGAAQRCSLSRTFPTFPGDGFPWIRQSSHHRPLGPLGQQLDVFHLHNEIFQWRKTVNHRVEILKDLGKLLHSHPLVNSWDFHCVLGHLLGNEEFLTLGRIRAQTTRPRESPPQLIENCEFAKPVVSRLTPVVTAAMVKTGGNCGLGAEQVAAGAGAMYSITGEGATYSVTGAGAAKEAAGAGAAYSITGAAGAGAMYSITGESADKVTAGAGAIYSITGAGAAKVAAGAGAT